MTVKLNAKQKLAKNIFFVNLANLDERHFDLTVNKLKSYVNFKIPLDKLDDIMKLIDLKDTLLLVDMKGISINSVTSEYEKLSNLGIQYLSIPYSQDDLDIFTLFNKLFGSNSVKNKPLLIADYMRDGITKDPSIQFKNIFGAEFSPLLTLLEDNEIPKNVKTFYSFANIQENNELLEGKIGDFIIDNHVILRQADIISSAKGCLKIIANVM